MAEGNEGFGDRWSRRKSEARGGAVVAEERRSDEDEATLAALTPAADAGGEVAKDAADAGMSPDDPEADPPDPADFDLPPIESLTVESDYSPFMRDGIPPALQRLALRRLWKLMPIVPDGLDDYDEDYSMIGMVVEKVSTLFKPGVGMQDPEPEPDDTSQDESGQPDESAEAPDESAEEPDESAEEPDESAEEKVASGDQAPSDGPEEGPEDGTEDGAEEGAEEGAEKGVDAESASAEGAGTEAGDDDGKIDDVESHEV